MNKFFSFLFWGFVAITSILLFFVAFTLWVFSLIFDRKRKWLLHQFTCFWASLYTWFNPLWNIRIFGKENIDSKKAYVCVSNHQSLLDILIMFRLFSHFKWVSKIENFKVPFIGWNMRFNDYIELDRGKVKSNAKMIKDCIRAISNQNSVMIFPEGTRSLDGTLKAFKLGAFEIAKATKAPILPIVLKGTAHALPKGGIELQGKHDMSITVLPEISPSVFENMSTEELTELVRSKIQEDLLAK
ncbi:MAG TPA: lysophospholipid acyltransferase family protein [Leptospiraceae bacterium]|nr:lysophospholipid acyltransferase family protein [Leptospiraceae bacterium]HMW07892.1 lysophospholipid acyltransferase family protein [Leptospiraceae bacterium]HMX33769.1 lysophospholipid acyltransferase family protein [Leptospiraceae bacterium]HMY31155.1 lysophospholipid acyltransferase family protein [Leptospiraceae bacterium]HMZ66662.1 lysophospholipid acyltransferase family protein [Leptospiraceae bacterium]